MMNGEYDILAKVRSTNPRGIGSIAEYIKHSIPDITATKNFIGLDVY